MCTHRRCRPSAFLFALMLAATVAGQDPIPEGMGKIMIGEGTNAIAVLLAKPREIENRADLLLELRNGYLGAIPVEDLQQQVYAWSKEHLHGSLSQITSPELIWLATNTLAAGPFTIDLAYLPTAKLAVTPNGPVSDCACVMPSSNEVSPCVVELLGRYVPGDYRIHLIVRDSPQKTVDALSSYAKQKGFEFVSRTMGSTDPVFVSELHGNRQKDE